MTSPTLLAFSIAAVMACPAHAEWRTQLSQPATPVRGAADRFEPEIRQFEAADRTKMVVTTREGNALLRRLVHEDPRRVYVDVSTPMLGDDGKPRREAIAADTLLVADKVGNVLLYVDVATGKVVRQVAVGENPHEVAITRDGRTAFVANPGSNTISVVDIASGREEKRLSSELFGFPHGLAVHPGGKTVYLTSERKQLLLAIDVASREISNQLATGMDGSHMVVLSPDGRRAYITDRGSAQVTVIDIDRWSVVAHVPAGNGVEGMSLAPDGRTLIVANRDDSDVHFIDTSTLKRTGTLAVGKEPVRVAISPDGRLALVSHRVSGDVHVIDLVSRTVSARVPVGNEPGGMTFSADGTQAFVANSGDGTISVLDLRRLQVVATHSAGKGPDGLALLKGNSHP